MIQVWSIWVRLFHWGLALVFAAEFFVPGGDDWHEWLGYAAGGIVLLRIVYGLFTQNPHEKTKAFFVGPKAFFEAVFGFFRHSLPRQIGHPPQAAFIMLMMFVTILATVGSGMLLETYEYFDSQPLQWFHQVVAYVTLGLVGIHVVGVLHASWQWGENLVVSMIHGRRRKN